MLEDTAIGVMGEPVVVNDVVTEGVMQPVERTPGAAPGGLRTEMDFDVLVALTVAAEDGQTVTVRGITGAIYAIEQISPTGKILRCGPVNRWDGRI